MYITIFSLNLGRIEAWVVSCRVISKFHYTDPRTLSANRPDPRTKSVHVEIAQKCLRPDKVRELVGADPIGLFRRPGRRPGSPTKSGRARLVEFGHNRVSEQEEVSVKYRSIKCLLCPNSTIDGHGLNQTGPNQTRPDTVFASRVSDQVSDMFGWGTTRARPDFVVV